MHPILSKILNVCCRPKSQHIMAVCCVNIAMDVYGLNRKLQMKNNNFAKYFDQILSCTIWLDKINNQSPKYDAAEKQIDAERNKRDIVCQGL